MHDGLEVVAAVKGANSPLGRAAVKVGAAPAQWQVFLAQGLVLVKVVVPEIKFDPSIVR